MNKSIGFGILVGLTVAAGAQAGQLVGSQDLVLSGRVESVNRAAGSITVLGHTVVTRDASRVADGQLVNVYGVISKDGSITDAVIESVTSYVPGVDQAYIKGVVTAVDASGSTFIGNTQVDYTSAAGAPQVGQLVAFTGFQATSSNVIRASKRAGIGAGGDGTSGIGAGGDRSQGIGAGGDGTSGIGAGGDRSQGIGAGGNGTSGIGAGGDGTSGIGAGGDRSQGIGAGGDGTSGIGAGGDGTSGIGAGGDRSQGIGAGGDGTSGIGAGGDGTSGIGAGGDRSQGIGAGGDRVAGIGAGGDGGG